jgi:hypothetical protein
MKRWALLTVLFYGVALILLSAPVIRWCAADFDFDHQPMYQPDDSITMAEVFAQPGYWIWWGVMLLGQALMLLVPMDVARERPVSRRKLLWPVITSAFLMANLVFAGIFCLLFLKFGDQAPDKILFWTNFGMPDSLTNPVEATTSKFLGVTLNQEDRTLLGAISILIFLWFIWGLVFYRFLRNPDPKSLVRRLTRWLLAGSILDFLIAVPSHVIVRDRDDCCAPAGTFWGIACGLSVMLLCFGPGVFFLFAERFKRLRPRPPIDAPRIQG